MRNATLRFEDGLVLHDLDAAANLLKVSRSQLRRLIDRGDLPVVIHGGRRMVADARVQALLQTPDCDL